MINIKTGTVEGTASSLAVACGFVPSYVKLMNIDGSPDCMEWTEDMTDGYGLKTVGAGTVSLVTSGGITPAGPGGATNGFSIGADTDVNVASQTILWLALGE